MSRTLAIALAALCALAACDVDGSGPCRVTLRLSWALDAVPEGRVREVPLRCGEEILVPGSPRIDRLVSDTPAVATIHDSYWKTSPDDTTGPHAGWYLLAHAPGTCHVQALRGSEIVASFDAVVVAQPEGTLP
jgi:hypothetical protein